MSSALPSFAPSVQLDRSSTSSSGGPKSTRSARPNSRLVHLDSRRFKLQYPKNLTVPPHASPHLQRDLAPARGSGDRLVLDLEGCDRLREVSRPAADPDQVVNSVSPPLRGSAVTPGSRLVLWPSRGEHTNAPAVQTNEGAEELSRIRTRAVDASP